MLRRKEEATGEEELDCRTEVKPQEGELEEWPSQTEKEVGVRFLGEGEGRAGREEGGGQDQEGGGGVGGGERDRHISAQ